LGDAGRTSSVSAGIAGRLLGHIERTGDNTVKLIAISLTLAVCVLAQSQRAVSDRARTRIEREVRHELVMLPYYGLFDNLAFRVDGTTVTLLGQVSRPTLKEDAGHVVKQIEGVEKVENQIEALPISPNDDRTRIATYRAIYGQTALNRYALQTVPPIHIIVKNGNVTLEGMVDSQNDKNIAGLQANSVSGVFSVTNNLRVESSR
jgi:hyperosmotically inducible protein